MLLINGSVQPSTPAKTAWLSSEVPGPYTTLRTIDSTRVVEGEAHVARLADTAQALLLKINKGEDGQHRVGLAPEAAAQLTDHAAMRKLFIAHTRAALEAFDREHPHAVAEKRVTVLINWGRSQKTEEKIQVRQD